MEVGVWKRSDFVHQLAADPSLFLVAIEPTQSSALSSAPELDVNAWPVRDGTERVVHKVEEVCLFVDRHQQGLERCG